MKSKPRFYTPEEDKFILDNYLTMPLKTISKALGRNESGARQRLKLLGYQVPKEIAEKFKLQNQFQKGQTSPTKGTKLSPEQIERMKPNMFKKGQVPHNLKPDGYERVTVDGYVEVKENGKFVQKHRKIWEEVNGPVPKGFIIIFRDNDKLNVTIDNLEMITREENIIRNNLAKGYDRDIQKAEYLRVKINQKIKRNGKKQTE